MKLRTEDGSLFNTKTPGLPSVVSLPVWQWVRLETGEETLIGPQATTQPRPPVIVRVMPGYQLPLTMGSAP